MASMETSAHQPRETKEASTNWGRTARTHSLHERTAPKEGDKGR